MKKILLLTTGGTIACVKTPDGLTPNLSAEELLNEVPEIRNICEPSFLEVMCIDSTNMIPSDWVKIAKAIEDNYNEYDGFVICHGTDTMPYTASALSYLIQDSPKPIVITGSQKPINFDTTDAKQNLYDSFLYATSDSAANVAVVFGGLVIAGPRARKIRSKSYNAFESVNFPELARIFNGKIHHYIYPNKNKQVKFYHELSDKVNIVNLFPGISEEIIKLYFEKSDVVIISSYGTGGIPSRPGYDLANVINEYVQRGKIVVISTQVQQEGSDMSIYKVCRGIDHEVRFLETYEMNNVAVLVKLMWILTQTKDFKEIKELFYRTINYDGLI